MPWRKNVVAAFASEVGVNNKFASWSCSGALEDARTRLRKAEAKFGTGGTLSDSDASSDSDDDDPAGFRRQARAATCKAKAVIAKDVADWQATEMAGLESTRLFRAMAPSRSWLKGVRRNLMCDAAGLAPLALMCGVYWPCPETRAGDFSSRRCVCGRKSSRGSLTWASSSRQRSRGRSRRSRSSNHRGAGDFHHPGLLASRLFALWVEGPARRSTDLSFPGVAGMARPLSSHWRVEPGTRTAPILGHRVVRVRWYPARFLKFCRRHGGEPHLPATGPTLRSSRNYSSVSA